MNGDFPGIAFVEAVNFTRTNGRTVNYGVVHDAETAEHGRVAENLAEWVSGPSAPRASWHVAGDNNSIVQSVLLKDVAWAAPGANSDGVQYEYAGDVRQTRAQWLDPFSLAAIDLSIEKVWIPVADRYALPTVLRREQDLIRGLRGFTGHVFVSRAFKRSDHTDPGTGFPYDYLLDGIREGLRPDHTPEPRKEFVALVAGDTGWRVKQLQRLLDQLPYIKLADDGEFGDYTIRAVKQLQRRSGIRATGRVGEPTWKALLKAKRGDQ